MKSEHLAYWYLRLNGFFTITNFIIHPEYRGSQRTDVDIAGIRLPYRSEFPPDPGGDDSVFLRGAKKPYFVIAEVKKGECALNGPWTDRARGNLIRFLTDLGPFPSDRTAQVAEELYKDGVSDSNSLYCSLFCIGNSVSSEVKTRYPKVPQKTWAQVIHFVYTRFKKHRVLKLDHQQWDDAGKLLWEIFDQLSSLENFERKIRSEADLPEA